MSPQLQTFVQHVVNGVSLGAIYSLIALGYTMVYGILQLINFAHSDVFMVGAYLGYFSGRWILGSALPDEPLFTFGIPLGIFLTVLNHKLVSRSLKLPAAPVSETSLLRAALLGAVSSAVATGIYVGVFHMPSQMPVEVYGIPVPAVVKLLIGLLIVAGPVLLVIRGLGLQLLLGLGLAAVVLFGVKFSFPAVASLAKGLQVGAIRATKPGKVTKVVEGRQLKTRVVIADLPQVLADDDEVTVKPGDIVTLGQVISKKGATAEIPGTVGAAGRGSVEIREIQFGDEWVRIPVSHAVLVKRDQEIAVGDKLSSGIVFGTPLLVLGFAMLGCATLGFLIERTAYRPLRHAPRINSLITAIGMSLLLVNSAQLIFGADPKGFPQIIPTLAPQQIGGVIVDIKQVTVLVVAVLLMILLQWVVYYTRLGLAMRAVSYNHAWAGLMGVPVDQVVSATFMIGSALAAAAGVLEGVTYKKIDPYLGMLLGLKAFVAAVLGGIGNLPGALIGGILMGLSEEMVAGYLSSNFRDAIAFLILIMILLYRPAGLLGKPTVEKV